jgi:5'-methylthioadenosine phosphorylase
LASEECDVGPLAVIGGSGAYDLLARDYSGARNLGRRETPFGPSAPVRELELNGRRTLFLSRHGETGYHCTARFVNYRANVYALRELGVTRVLAWSGPGAIEPSLEIGQYVVPDDLLDETHARDDTYFTGGSLGFVRQSPVFCPALREAALEACRATGAATRDGGTYACTEGPRLETPAEVRKLRIMGADLVGMTLAPEVFLAKELTMCYAAVCYVTNYAEGLAHKPFVPGVLFEGLLDSSEVACVDAAVAGFAQIVAQVAAAEPGDCHCARLLDRYKSRGTIGEDWREWIGR